MTNPSPFNGWVERRVLVVVAHPDDEVLGCGALIATLRDVKVVHVTDGAPRNGVDLARLGFERSADYARARRAEALAALSLAGLTAETLVQFGVADQEASADLAGIARRLGVLIGQADIVLTHAFEGGHSDHDAVAFAVQAACCLVSASADVFEMPFYYGTETGWVRQRFLPAPLSLPLLIRRLSPAERVLKARMIDAHATQRDTLASFSLDREVFRIAPPNNFTIRPHEGPLLYERHGWNLTWATWMARVREAHALLGFDPS